MIANNIFRWIGDLFTNVLFKPMDWIRDMDSWGMQNALNWVFIIICFVAFVYWMGQLKKFKQEGNE